MKKYSHNFVESYDGFPGFGLDRESNENTVICYLQMFSDDMLMKNIVSRFSEEELEEVYSMINRLLKIYLNDTEYHRLFLKEEHP
ncbi:MAG: cytoplasmic protein [Desulfobacteraceae bacterium]|nr:cytoplasmic protein [Desulfobacteraceae bacterium]MBC2756485.1 cytoplasmic protein [Desulfobacteraceae bacterium]